PQQGGACTSCGHYDACRGGCMAAKFFTGLPLDGPDPECVKGYGELRLATVEPGSAPRPSLDHSRGAGVHTGGAVPPEGDGPVGAGRAAAVPVTIGLRRPDRACDENPLAAMGR
ncbi:MAG: hypothetical protein ACRD0J_07880, partial [Acidimicrobiales bacterium]